MFVPGENENEQADDWEPGPEVTRDFFLEWRDARRGNFPGEVMTNPVWRWLIDSNISATVGTTISRVQVLMEATRVGVSTASGDR